MNSENLAYKVECHDFNKIIQVPSSKSYANRALIIGAILGNNYTIYNLPESSDVINLINCLEAIGLSFTRISNQIIFHNSFPACELKTSVPVILQTGDGGTTNRFLVALLALGKNEYHLIPSEKMNERPMDDLLNPLQELGVALKKGENQVWLSVQGPIQFLKSEISIDCSKSTQFASALSLATINQKIKIQYSNVNSSADYLRMTDAVIEKSLKDNNFYIPVDFSSLSYPAVLAAINGKVTIKNCQERDGLQADSVLIDLLNNIGVRIKFETNGLTIESNGTLKSFDFDVSSCPDLTMSLVVLASRCSGKSTLKNLSVLIHKESNRLNGIVKLLEQFEIPFDLVGDNLVIEGTARKIGECSVLTERDHRMVMMGYLLLRLHSGGKILNSDCVAKSFSDFFETMN